jgi:L-rhamnose-H+ transport protein
MNALLGILFIGAGGLASASFYLPLKNIKKWSWESGWLIYSLFALLAGPWFLVLLTIPDAGSIIGEVNSKSIFWPILFGFGFGVGGLTWGLSIRFMGIGLGNVFPLGMTLILSTIVGPLIPVILDPGLRTGSLGSSMGEKLGILFSGDPGLLIIISIILALARIAICGWAASRKDAEQKSVEDDAIKEFNLKKGLLAAFFSGTMSACFTFGEYAGGDMTSMIGERNPGSIWNYNLVYAFLCIGGFTVNFSYCLYRGIRNSSTGDYITGDKSLGRNYILASLAGMIWFSQFVFKGIGTVKMPEHMTFITWSLLFTFLIVFSNLVGLLTREWKGISNKTIIILVGGLLTLVISVVLVGLAGNL